MFHVPGADADFNAGDRTYLVLAKPNVIMNDLRLEGWRLRELRLQQGRTSTTRPDRSEPYTLPAKCGVWCPAASKPRGRTANRLPT